jgi:DtxR family Mn-dependent transcriptional regulator
MDSPSKPNRRRLTPAEEEYLESIFMHQRRFGRGIRVKELAEELGVRDPSAVQMLRKLSGKGLVRYGRRLGARLTRHGARRAAMIVRRHELAERLLHDVFGRDLYRAHEEACKFEHVLDDELADEIEAMLGRPKTCPHGSPIPGKDGRVERLEAPSLDEVAEGERCEILAIPEDREALQRLMSLNLIPGSVVEVVERAPLGALMVRCGGAQVALSRNLAARILVRRHVEKRARRGYRHGARR